jgi:hypothetical protein
VVVAVVLSVWFVGECVLSPEAVGGEAAVAPAVSRYV